MSNAYWMGQPLESISDSELERARSLTKANLDGVSSHCPFDIMQQFALDYATAECEFLRREWQGS